MISPAHVKIAEFTLHSARQFFKLSSAIHHLEGNIVNKPIILCGLGRVGWRVLEFLQAANFTVVVVDDFCDPKDPRLGSTRLVRGDCRRREVLDQAGLAECRGILIVTSNDLVNISTALMVRSMNPEVRIVLRVFNEGLIGRLGHAIHNIFPLSPSALTAPILAVKALTGQALGTFRVEGIDKDRRQVAELTIHPGSPIIGRTLKEVVRRFDVLILVHISASGGEHFLTEADLKAKLQAGDQLSVCGKPADLAALLAEERGEKADNLLYAGWFRRTGRVLWRTLDEIDLSVKASTLTLLGVVFIGTLFFVWLQSTGIADALYHTVSVVATAADMRTDRDADELKFFVSGLRIIGAAMMAVFTAILTNYLIRASLGGALEVRRIPDGGHFITVGLGAIGYRVVEELVRAGERVVAIEVDRDNRFIPTVRQKGVPVIIGDATLPDVMKQAHSPKARAVIVCSSNDLINLEVALLARELMPGQRVVLIQADQQLAQLLRDAANVRLAVSVPVLVAPAFVAGLFGDRVLSVFVLRERLMAVIDLVIQPQDTHLVGQSARTVAIDHGLLPVAIIPADGSPPPRNPMNAGLSAGDRLVAVVALHDMERLLRRNPAPKGWLVEVIGYPPSAKEWLTLFVQREQLITEDEALAALEHLPLVLEQELTRGQATDLLALLEREQVRAVMRRTT
jgi:Trk K+ transport system NAD-binding subunit